MWLSMHVHLARIHCRCLTLIETACQKYNGWRTSSRLSLGLDCFFFSCNSFDLKNSNWSRCIFHKQVSCSTILSYLENEASGLYLKVWLATYVITEDTDTVLCERIWWQNSSWNSHNEKVPQNNFRDSAGHGTCASNLYGQADTFARWSATHAAGPSSTLRGRRDPAIEGSSKIYLLISIMQSMGSCAKQSHELQLLQKSEHELAMFDNSNWTVS